MPIQSCFSCSFTLFSLLFSGVYSSIGWQSSEVDVVSAAVGDHVSGNSYGISFGMTYLLFAAAAVAVTYTVGKNIERRDLFYFEAEV